MSILILKSWWLWCGLHLLWCWLSSSLDEDAFFVVKLIEIFHFFIGTCFYHQRLFVRVMIRVLVMSTFMLLLLLMKLLIFLLKLFNSAIHLIRCLTDLVYIQHTLRQCGGEMVFWNCTLVPTDAREMFNLSSKLKRRKDMSG